MTKPNLNGPESVPLRSFISSFKAIVLVRTIKDDILIRKEEIDYGDIEQRKWLGKVSYWAWQNDCYVKTLALKDYVEDS